MSANKAKSKRTVAEWEELLRQERERADLHWLALSDVVTGREVAGAPVSAALAASETDEGRVTATVYRPTGPAGGILVLRTMFGASAHYAEAWINEQRHAGNHYAILAERVRLALYRVQHAEVSA